METTKCRRRPELTGCFDVLLPRTAYDPLSTDTLQVNFALELLAQPLEAFPPSNSFAGAGVYGLYYVGTKSLYAPLARRPHLTPIYVGQSARPKRPQHPALFQRMGKHAKSIDASGDLRLSEFQCRSLVLVPSWIEFAEHLLIDIFNPVWNNVLTGLGSNPTGGPRSPQRLSRWDALHGGRAGAGTGAARWTTAELRRLVRDHLTAHPPRRRRP